MLSRSISYRLQYQHETLDELLEGFSEEQLGRRIIPGKWSIFEQVAHLAAYQPTFYDRLQRMQHDNNPGFDRYVADNDPLFHECCGQQLASLLTELKNKRMLINEYLNTRTEEQLRRTGIHPKFGQMTVAGWTEFFLLHEAHHLFSIFMLARDMNIHS